MENYEAAMYRWIKWREALKMSPVDGIQIRMKGRFRKTVVRPTMLNVSKCWTILNKIDQKMRL